MVWYKRKIVVVPMIAVALVFVIALPMAVTSSKRKESSVSASTSGENEVPPIEDRDAPGGVDSDGSEIDSGVSPSPSTEHSTSASEHESWNDLMPGVDEVPSAAHSDAPSLVPSDQPSMEPSTLPSLAAPSDYPSMIPSSIDQEEGHLGGSDYPSLTPVGWGTPAPTPYVARFNRLLYTSEPTPVPSLEKAHLGSDFPSLTPVGWGTPAPTTEDEAFDVTYERRRRRRKTRKL